MLICILDTVNKKLKMRKGKLEVNVRETHDTCLQSQRERGDGISSWSVTSLGVLSAFMQTEKLTKHAFSVVRLHVCSNYNTKVGVLDQIPLQPQCIL